MGRRPLCPTGQPIDARAAADDDDRPMPGPLKAREQEERDQVSDRERIGGWLETGVDAAGIGEMLPQRVGVGLLVDESAKREIVEKLHRSGAEPSTCSAAADCPPSAGLPRADTALEPLVRVELDAQELATDEEVVAVAELALALEANVGAVSAVQIGDA